MLHRICTISGLSPEVRSKHYLMNLANAENWDLITSCSINEDGESTQSIDNCVYIQQYFQFYGYQTQVLPAALTTPDECMKLAGVQHITIAPALLQSLAEIRRSDTGSQFDYWEPQAFCKMVEQYRRNVGFSRSSDKVIPATEPPTLIGDQAAFRMALTRNDSGSSELKQIYAINEFCEAQIKLENLLMPHLWRMG